MNRLSSNSRRPPDSEQGYVLVAVIFLMVILILSLSVAIPKVREDIQRDRDQETMERGKQYIRAIQLYYRKFNAYPPNVDALVKTNNLRFLRKKYIDPMTGKDDWKPIMWGQNKTPIAMGFFGQPLAAAIGGGIGPSGGNTPGANPASGTSGLFNSPAGGTSPGTSPGTSGFGNSSFGGSSSGSSTFGGSSGTSAFGNSPSGTTGSTGQTGTGASPGGTDANGNQNGSTGSTGSTGFSSNGSGNPTGNGQSFGGAGIIGFSPASPKQSIYVYKKKNHYNEWEFLYSPQMDQQQMGGGNTGTIGQPASGTSNPIGSSSFGNPSNSTGTTPTAPTSPTTPQQ